MRVGEFDQVADGSLGRLLIVVELACLKPVKKGGWNSESRIQTFGKEALILMSSELFLLLQNYLKMFDLLSVSSLHQLRGDDVESDF